MPTRPSRPRPVEQTPAATAPDRVLTGPQGAVGQSSSSVGSIGSSPTTRSCNPGESGASHLHQFFGAVDVSVESGYDELLAGDTTCDQQSDTASYWSPVLVDADGGLVEPLGSGRLLPGGTGRHPVEVVAYPPGMMMVAGDHTAVEPQPLSVVAWSWRHRW